MRTDQQQIDSKKNYDSVEHLHLCDLDAYNYLSGFMFDGIGTSEDANMDPALRNELFRNELLSSKLVLL